VDFDLHLFTPFLLLYKTRRKHAANEKREILGDREDCTIPQGWFGWAVRIEFAVTVAAPIANMDVEWSRWQVIFITVP
jgi:hypothetical protein